MHPNTESIQQLKIDAINLADYLFISPHVDPELASQHIQNLRFMAGSQSPDIGPALTIEIAAATRFIHNAVDGTAKGTACS